MLTEYMALYISEIFSETKTLQKYRLRKCTDSKNESINLSDIKLALKLKEKRVLRPSMNS